MSEALANAAQRAAVYELLGRLWHDAPDDEVLRHIQSWSRQADVPDSAQRLAAACERPQDGQDDLAVEFTRLFIGPSDHLPPFQSVWEERRLEGEAAASLRRYAEVLGDDTRTDHFSCELLMMATILNDGGDPASLESLAQSFFADHLTWPSDLLGAVENRSTEPFYVALAQFTRDFLTTERSVLLPS